MRRAERALYERLLEEKDKHIRNLAAEISWLHAYKGVPRAEFPVAGHPPVAEGRPATTAPEWESEYDEARTIIEKNELSGVHLQEILDGLGVGSSDLN